MRGCCSPIVRKTGENGTKTPGEGLALGKRTGAPLLDEVNSGRNQSCSGRLYVMLGGRAAPSGNFCLLQKVGVKQWVSGSEERCVTEV